MESTLDNRVVGNLVLEVMFPFIDEVISETGLDINDSSIFLLKMHFFKLAVAPFKKRNRKERILEKSSIDKIQELIETDSKFCNVVENFISLYEGWFYSYNKLKDRNIDIWNEIKARLEDVENIPNCVSDESEDSEFMDFDDDDEFFDLDSDFGSDEMNEMHYEEHEKISASEFLESGAVIEVSYLIQDLEEALEEFEARTIAEETLTHFYLDEFVKFLTKFLTFLNSTSEFRDLAYALDTLKYLIDDSILERDEDEVKLLKAMFDSVVLDLEKWIREVLEEESAIDIHYLDASLLANVKQIEMILNKK